jgi:hypothetical protein
VRVSSSVVYWKPPAALKNLGFRDLGLKGWGSEAQCWGLKTQGLGVGVQGSGFRVNEVQGFAWT